MGTRTRITDARARRLAPPPGREAVLWDSEVAGVGLRARPSGRKTWIVHRRSAGSVLRRSLGSPEAATAGDARCIARALIAAAPGATATTAPLLRAFGRAFLDDCESAGEAERQ